MYAPLKPRPIMDITNPIRATRCRREPLRNDMAAAPDSNPTTPEQIWKTNMGENRISVLSSRAHDPRCAGLLLPSLFVHALGEQPKGQRSFPEETGGDVEGRQLVGERW